MPISEVTYIYKSVITDLDWNLFIVISLQI